ncbi:transglutaminase domain-containing protein [bacterium]|nr:transglutaminase domain-containing protein [bacterium]
MRARRLLALLPLALVPVLAASLGRAQDEVPVDRFADRPGIFRLRGVYEAAAIASSDGATVELPLPLVWGQQVPLRWEVRAKPQARLASWKAVERKPRDWIARLTLAKLEEGERFDLEWEADVLCGPSAFRELPAGVPLARLNEVPKEARLWLASTKCVQCDAAPFKKIAKKLREEAEDLADLQKKIVAKLAEIQSGQSGMAEDLGALEALEHQGSCTSAANLACAVFRACGFPARTLAGYPVWSGPLQTHYVIELYFPRVGWVPLESTLLRTPWPSSQQLEVALVYPEDEDRSGARACAAPGVPYLSLTEAPGAEESLQLVGKVPAEHPGCDHVATREHDLRSNDSRWPPSLAKAKKHWEKWLERAKSGPPGQDFHERRRPLGAQDDLGALESELDRLLSKWL